LIYYDFMNILIMSLLKCHWLCTCFLGAISPIKQKLISIKFSTHIDAIPKLYLTPLIFLWRHRVSRDSVSKGQISKVNICKREWSIDFNFGVSKNCQVMSSHEYWWGNDFFPMFIYVSTWGKIVGFFLNFLLQLLRTIWES